MELKGLGLSAGPAAELTGLGAELDPGLGWRGLNLVPPPGPSCRCDLGLGWEFGKDGSCWPGSGCFCCPGMCRSPRGPGDAELGEFGDKVTPGVGLNLAQEKVQSREGAEQGRGAGDRTPVSVPGCGATSQGGGSAPGDGTLGTPGCVLGLDTGLTQSWARLGDIWVAVLLFPAWLWPRWGWPCSGRHQGWDQPGLNRVSRVKQDSQS